MHKLLQIVHTHANKVLDSAQQEKNKLRRKRERLETPEETDNRLACKWTCNHVFSGVDPEGGTGGTFPPPPSPWS